MHQSSESTSLLPPVIKATLTAAGLEINPGYQCVPATALLQKYHPQVEIELPLLISDLPIDGWSRLQSILQNAYPVTHPVLVITAAAEGNTGVLPFVQTTLQELTGLSSMGGVILLCVPPLPAGSSFSALQAIVAHLRSPQGCPWDRKQTLLSMRHDLLSECAEVLEAIDLDQSMDNGSHIAEELGDLLMAGVLMVQIATDEGRFQLAEVMHSIVTKLIRRHPHVFGDVTVDGVETVLANWDAIKAQEKAAKGQSQPHPLDGIPAILPALEKARELQSKAAKAGLLDRAAIAQADPHLAPWRQTPLTEELLGELLWRIVALAHTADLNAEDALRSYGTHFRAAHK